MIEPAAACRRRSMRTMFLFLTLASCVALFGPRHATMLRAQSAGADRNAPREPAGTESPPPAPNGKEVSTQTRDDLPTASSNSVWTQREVIVPIVILIIGVVLVLGAIIVGKINAFLAMIGAAIVVSLCAPGELADKVERVARSFGGFCGGIGIVIAAAAVIGKCMLDSGAADRVVRAFVRLTGERRAPWALMASGYVLAIPVFFDTVFYLLVPLARSLHRRTHTHYLKYLMAIVAGGAITHTLVPPTPGPLLMASTLNIDLGMMILVGALIAFPAAVAGLLFAALVDRLMPIPMRTIGALPDPEPLPDHELPPLWISLLPVVLPVVMISLNTICTTIADQIPAARFQPEDVRSWNDMARFLNDNRRPAQHVRSALQQVMPGAVDWNQLESSPELQSRLIEGLNRLLVYRPLYDEGAVAGTVLSEETRKLAGQDRTRMRRAELEHFHRLLLEDVVQADGRPVLERHQWRTGWRRASEVTSLVGNANLALLVSAAIAMATLCWKRKLTFVALGQAVESALMSAGIIILITAAGGAFGQMLKEAGVGHAIETVFGDVLRGSASGFIYLAVGFTLAAVLKIAQGSSTVAMIVGSSMMSAIVAPDSLPFHQVYLATAIGAGSLVGSWMNDSGFWVYAKMGGLTETESLKSWTLLLIVLALTSAGCTFVLASIMPLK
ncbi:MAG: gnt-II system L-idonate transporter [Pirellulaceae bacterium]|nr:MAG: gnt-II system L-idonate transporter [Pirellulaceae bacterium]